jgi:hypothetical protein
MIETRTRRPRFAGRIFRLLAAVAVAAGLVGGMALASQSTAAAAPGPAVAATPAAHSAPATASVPAAPAQAVQPGKPVIQCVWYSGLHPGHYGNIYIGPNWHWQWKGTYWDWVYNAGGWFYNIWFNPWTGYGCT